MRCGVCSPPFNFITQDISPQTSPQTKKTKKNLPEPFVQAQSAKVKQLSVSVMSKDWPDSMALTLQQIDDVKNIRSAGTFRPDKAASPKDASTRSTLCQ